MVLHVNWEFLRHDFVSTSRSHNAAVKLLHEGRIYNTPDGYIHAKLTTATFRERHPLYTTKILCIQNEAH